MMQVRAEQRVSMGDQASVRFPSALVSCSPALFQGLSGKHVAVMQAMYAAALKAAEDRVAREQASAVAVGLN
jgi:hypothetical protein